MVKNAFKERSDRRRGRADFRRAEKLAGRPLPHSLEAEEMMLACCLLDGAEVITRAYAAGVREGSFFDTKHGLIWAVLERLWKEKKATEISVVAEVLKEERTLEQVGGYAFLAQVSSRVPTVAQAGYFIEQVVKQAELRELIRTGTALVEECFAYSGGEVVEHVGDKIERLMDLRVKAQRELPAIIPGRQFAEVVPEVPPWLIKNILRVREVYLFTAESKGTKSWQAIDQTIALSAGLPWLGFETVKSDVLHIDLELEMWALRDRAALICKARGIELPHNVDWWGLRGFAKSIDELIPHIQARAARGRYKAITLEPSYLLLGGRDENDNGDVTEYFMLLMLLARVTGAAIMTSHHHAKGDSSKKAAKDRMSGAGAWARAPDVLVNLSALSEEQGADTYAVEFTERHTKKPATLGVKWDFPLMRPVSGLDVNALREAGAPKTSTAEDIVALLPEAPDGLTYSQWFEKAQRKIRGRDGEPISKSTFNRRVKESAAADQISQVGSLYVRSR